jgi:hypothetical protein
MKLVYSSEAFQKNPSPENPHMNQSSTLTMDGAVDQQLAFSQKLQALTNKVHSIGNIDEIMIALSRCTGKWSMCAMS